MPAVPSLALFASSVAFAAFVAAAPVSSHIRVPRAANDAASHEGVSIVRAARELAPHDGVPRGADCNTDCNRKASDCIDLCEEKFKDDDKARVTCKFECTQKRQQCEKSCG